MHTRYRGLVAAPFTPFHADLSVNLDVIPGYARLLRENGVSAAFVCGTTGEGMSLTQAERMAVAEAWIRQADDKLRVIVHVGHNCLTDAQELSRHAAEVGASAIAACAPSFFKPRDHDELVDWCTRLAGAAPSVPFYYYNIPSMTGVSLKVAPFLAKAQAVIPSLEGVKYTHEDLADYQECVKFDGRRYDILFGRDELLLEGWELQALGAVGSTYNYAAPLYAKLLAHLEAGRAADARALQDQAIRMIAICNSVGVSHLAASKSLMALLGVDCGPTRPPVRTIDKAQFADLQRQLGAMDFFSLACRAA